MLETLFFFDPTAVSRGRWLALMNLFWQRLDLIRRTQSTSTEDSTTMEYVACDSIETPSQDSAMSEDVDMSDPAWRMSHPHLVRAMEAREMMSDRAVSA